MLLISFWRKLFSALLAVTPELFDEARYMPVQSIPTASLFFSSFGIPASSFCTLRSSGASMVKSSSMFSSVPATFSPVLNVTERLAPPDDTVAFTSSLAAMLSDGFAGSPVNST